MADVEAMKQRAALRVVEEVDDGMVLGLGSGSTAAHAIREIGERVSAGLDVVGVPTSRQSAAIARDAGVPIRCLQDVSQVDLAIDGADQVAGTALIKGGGGAHAREKVVDAAADRFAVIVDSTKHTDTLDRPIPLEILPDALPYVATQVQELGGAPTLRSDTLGGPTLTDNGNVLLDCAFGPINTPESLGTQLATLPGVVEHGIFHDMADVVYVATAEAVEVIGR